MSRMLSGDSGWQRVRGPRLTRFSLLAPTLLHCLGPGMAGMRGAPGWHLTRFARLHARGSSPPVTSGHVPAVASHLFPALAHRCRADRSDAAAGFDAGYLRRIPMDRPDSVSAQRFTAQVWATPSVAFELSRDEPPHLCEGAGGRRDLVLFARRSPLAGCPRSSLDLRASILLGADEHPSEGRAIALSKHARPPRDDGSLGREEQPAGGSGRTSAVSDGTLSPL